MDLLNLINAIAAQHGLPTTLVQAIVQVESNGRPWAVRYEPGFFSRYVEGRQPAVYAPCSRDTEEHLRACSFGLMQIMGQTARELGFRGVYLTELCDPGVGLEWGCRLLAALVVRHHGQLTRVAAAYNAGSVRLTPQGEFVNQAYVDRVAKAGGFA